MEHFQRLTILWEESTKVAYTGGKADKVWSYGSETEGSRETDKKINQLIKEGWEIAAAVPLNTTTSLREKVNEAGTAKELIYPQTITQGIEVLLVKR